MKNKYKYGDCIPISIIVYKRLYAQGYQPLIVEGWVMIKNEDIFFEHNNKAKSNKIQHTYIYCNKHIIDITKNQFDIYGGIKKYLTPKERYKIK